MSNANSQITQLYSDMQAKNSPYGDILAPGDASGLNVNGYLMSRFGLNGVPTSKKGDKYYIAVDANNKLRSGIQVNGADKITWKEVATKDDLPNIYGVKFDKNNEASDHVQTIKNVWNKFPDSQPFVCTLADANQCIIIGFVYSNRKYGAVLYLAFNSCGIVKCNGGTFSDTKL